MGFEIKHLSQAEHDLAIPSEMNKKGNAKGLLKAIKANHTMSRRQKQRAEAGGKMARAVEKWLSENS